MHSFSSFVDLLLRQFRLLVELHESDETNQSHKSDNPGRSTRPTSLRDTGRWISPCELTEQRIPNPAYIWYYGNSSEDVKPEEKCTDIPRHRYTGQNDLKNEEKQRQYRQGVEDIVLFLRESDDSNIIEEERIDGQEGHPDNEVLIINGLLDRLLGAVAFFIFFLHRLLLTHLIKQTLPCFSGRQRLLLRVIQSGWRRGLHCVGLLIPRTAFRTVDKLGVIVYFLFLFEIFLLKDLSGGILTTRDTVHYEIRNWLFISLL